MTMKSIMQRWVLVAAGVIGSGAAQAAPSTQAVDPADIQFVDTFPNLTFDNPLYITFIPDGTNRALVVQQRGLVYLVDNTPDVTEATVALDLSDRVSQRGNETGLLGLALDPKVLSNGRFYVNYTTGNRDITTRISRFDVLSTNPPAGDPNSEVILLSIPQPYSNHKGGWLGFGPDNKLYVALGDGGSSGDPENNAQNLGSLLGKVLRINTNGSVPANNPFVDDPNAAPEIYAYGFRNPYRMSFDSLTGYLWAGDVGQEEIEEVDYVRRGKNYGWRKYEGTTVYNAEDPEPANPVFPVYEYAHEGVRCSIIGGYVYRGSAIPSLQNHYLLADYCSREVFAVELDSTSKKAVSTTLLGTVPDSPTSFGVDTLGELYITAFDGKIYKISPAQ